MDNLAASEGIRTLEILNVVRIFVFNFREKIDQSKTCHLEKEDVNTDEDSEIGSVTKLIMELEEARAEDARLVEEMEKVPCPEEGFHCDKAEDFENEEEEYINKGPNEQQKFLKSALDYVKHYISMAGQPAWQVTHSIL